MFVIWRARLTDSLNYKKERKQRERQDDVQMNRLRADLISNKEKESLASNLSVKDRDIEDRRVNETTNKMYFTPHVFFHSSTLLM